MESDSELQGLAQLHLDQRWSPEQVAHELHLNTPAVALRSRSSSRRSTASRESRSVMPAAYYAPADPTDALAVAAT